ncbi:MAG: M20/M25/M40 family metallo-hydrolase [Candidatus Dojkabacteria bacterium]|nr:M20/M25/M40 family metallo-hydrolase [Candidatus Dojkabacteria bacterium]
MNKLTDTFLKLVRIDSPSGSEANVREFIISFLVKLGIDCSNIDQEGNLTVTIPGNSEHILFTAHMDTVEPGRGIKPCIKNDVIVSGGNTILGADNKVTIAALLVTLEKLIRVKNRHALEIIFTVREETDNGLNNYYFKNLKAKKAFIFDAEGNVGSLIIKAPYIDDFEVEIRGKQTHCSTPEKGKNALLKLFEIGCEINLGRISNDTLFNIGLIHGGTATNTVPDKIILKGDIRSFDKGEFLGGKDGFNKILDKIESKNGYNAKVDWIKYSDGYEHKKNSRYVKRLIEVYRMLGITLRHTSAQSGSDANIINSKGIKAYCLSYGAWNAHTTREYIAIDQLFKLQQIVEKIILKY